MRVDFRDHVCLRMARIALRGLQIAVIQLQLVGGAGVAQRVEDHVGQPSLPLQVAERLFNHPGIAGTPIFVGDDQVEILVFAAEKFLHLRLRLLPFPQDVGDRLGQPDLANAALRLGALENQARRRVFHDRLKDIEDILFTEHVDGALRRAGQLLVDIDPRIVGGNVGVADVNIVPGQAEDFSETERAGKRQVHGDVQLAFRAGVQRLTNGVCVPDFLLLVVRPGQDRVVEGISPDDLPAHRLLERAAHQLENFLDVAVSQVLAGRLVRPGGHGRRGAQLLNELVNRARVDLLHLLLPDQGNDVVDDQRAAGVVHGYAPLLFSAELHEVPQELLDRLLARLDERALEHFRFDGYLAGLRLLIGFAGFPLLFGFTPFVRIVVNDVVPFSTFHDRCHCKASCVVTCSAIPTTHRRTSVKCELPSRF